MCWLYRTSINKSNWKHLLLMRTDVRPIERSSVTEVKEAVCSNTVSQPYLRPALQHTPKMTQHECIVIGDSVELLVVIFGLPKNVSDCRQIILTVFSSVQKGYSRMLHINVETNMRWGTWKNLKIAFSVERWPSFTSYHLAGHLEWQLLPEITKTAIISNRVDIKTGNKNWTPLSLDQSSTST